MTRINLLPWRELQRKRREKIFYAALALSTLLMVGVLLLINSHISALMENQKRRNQYLQEQITILDKQINKIKDLEKEKDKLLMRMDIIQKLQASRPQIVHIFDELVRTVPSGVYLESIKRQNHINTLHGVAESETQISTFMRNLEDSVVFQSPKLEIIEKIAKNQGVARKFTLLVNENEALAKEDKDE